MNRIVLLFIILTRGMSSFSQNSNCSSKLQKGIYYSTSGLNNSDTTFHKISDKFFIGFSKKTSFYYKNKLTWGDSCSFKSEHFKNNSEMSHFKKGTGYNCRLIEVKSDFFQFTYYGEETGSTGTLTYYKYNGRIPKRYRKIRKMKHNPWIKEPNKT